MLKYIALFILLLLIIRYVRYLAEKLAAPQGSGNVGGRRSNMTVNDFQNSQPKKDYNEGEYIEFEEVEE